jgi:glycerol uptake facilitator protein
MAEALGTGLLVLVGAGTVVAMLRLSDAARPTLGGADLVAVAAAFAVVIATLVVTVGPISGCHINPAITVALAATRRFAWADVPAYIGAQLGGATVGAFVLWAIYAQQGVNFGLGQTTLSVGTSWPQAMVGEGVGTYMLALVVVGSTADGAVREISALVIGGVVGGLVLLLGPVTGGALNPARTLGPELASALAGGRVYWTQFVPIYVLPGLLGAGLGVLTYTRLTGRSLARQPSLVSTPTLPEPRDAATRR